MISIFPPHQEIIDHFLDEGKASTSDVIRQALEYYHRKLYPDYIYRLTPAGEEKRRKLAEQEAANLVSDEEFAVQHLKSLIRTKKDGTRAVILHTIANSVKVIPLEGIKLWAHDNEHAVTFHLDLVKERSLEETINHPWIKQELEATYGIITTTHDQEVTN